MSLFSVSPAGRMKVWQGLLADLQADGRVWGKDAMLIATDVPGTVWFGNGTATFNQLQAVGKVKRSGGAIAVNTTAAGTAAVVLSGIVSGLITSTSAAAVTLTLPTAAQLAAAFGGVKGVIVEFVVDNAAGANSVTVAIATGVTVNTAVLTGSDTLAVASGKVGIFRLYFVSATAVLLSRVS